jgi:TolB-like protein
MDCGTLKKLLPLLILTLFLGGCASTSQSIPRRMSDMPKSELTTVSIKRQSSLWGAALRMMVYDGSRLVGRLGPGGTLTWERPVGNMVLRITQPDLFSGANRLLMDSYYSLDLSQDKNYRFFVDSNGRFKSLDGEQIDTEGFVGGQQECISGNCDNGQGTMTFPGGRQYVGEWKDGKPNGQGTYTGPIGKYVGEFKDGNRHGQGTMTFIKGDRYVGEFKDDSPNGQGTHISLNGDKYVGEVKDGKYDGKGVAYKVNGEIQSGTWVNNEFQKPWTIDAVSRFLKNKYPQFTGFDSEPSTPVATAVKSSGASISGFIAVLEFEGNNISSGEVRALTDRLRSELVGTGQLTIIERGKMEEILKEQSFQQTGCVSSECAVEVGKLLGVEQIVTGNISKVGTFFSVTARVVSVSTGEIVRSTIYDHSGDIGGLLTQGMRKVAEELGK